jgi:MFS family permease
MWELYAFWAFVPVILLTYQNMHNLTELSIPLWSFIIIAIGGIACVIGGYLSSSYGLDKVARSALLLSGLCCLLSPFAFLMPLELFLLFLLIWGMAVIADSPLFSSLVAQTAPPVYKGTALTIVTSLGFFITIISIQLISMANQFMDSRYIFLILAFGPFFGLITRKR